ncbi:MAG: hypothetical protein AAGJ85_04065, partial [Pseudomonadota bacterium]
YYRLEFHRAIIRGNFILPLRKNSGTLLRGKGMYVGGYLSLSKADPQDSRQSEKASDTLFLRMYKPKAKPEHSKEPVEINLQGVEATVFEHEYGAWPDHGRLVIIGLIYSRVGTNGPFFVNKVEAKGDFSALIEIAKRVPFISSFLLRDNHPGLDYLSRQVRIPTIYRYSRKRVRHETSDANQKRLSVKLRNFWSRHFQENNILSAQPYQVASAALRESGQDRAAKFVEYERIILSNRDRDRMISTLVSVTSYITGYGYNLSRYFWIVVGVIAFFYYNTPWCADCLKSLERGDKLVYIANLLIPLLDIAPYNTLLDNASLAETPLECINSENANGEDCPSAAAVRLWAGATSIAGWVLSAIFAVTIPPRLYAAFQSREAWKPSKK